MDLSHTPKKTAQPFTMLRADERASHFSSTPFPENTEKTERPTGNKSSPNSSICALYAKAIDVYCDTGAFTLEESLEILRATKEDCAYVTRRTSCPHRNAARSQTGRYMRRSPSKTSAMKTSRQWRNTIPLASCFGVLSCTYETPPHRSKKCGRRGFSRRDRSKSRLSLVHICGRATFCLLQGTTVREAVLGITKHGASARRAQPWVAGRRFTDFSLFLPPVENANH